MNNQDDHFNIFPELKSSNMKHYADSNNITWLKNAEDVPCWLKDMFLSSNYKNRMNALRKINSESMSTKVENN